jgi:catechol 2,3-dioxygenase-like lactoylglutathione lyase family enzyme
VPRFHHVNLGVASGGVSAEAGFLVEVLGYRPVEVDDRMRALGVHWFEADDGSQVHLSEDPDHRPAARAHVAIEFGPELAEVERRLEQAAVSYRPLDQPGGPHVVFCRDPAGNRWELRG